MVTQGYDTFSTNEQPGGRPPEVTVFKSSAGWGSSVGARSLEEPR